MTYNEYSFLNHRNIERNAMVKKKIMMANRLKKKANEKRLEEFAMHMIICVLIICVSIIFMKNDLFYEEGFGYDITIQLTGLVMASIYMVREIYYFLMKEK